MQRQNKSTDIGNVVIYDIETLQECYLYMDKIPGTDIWHSFTISKHCNEVDAMVKYLKEADIDYMCGFNCLGFDWQVQQYILDNHEKWYDLTGQEIVDKIYQFAQDIIKNRDYDILPPYREEYFDRKQIDLFTIHGYENKNKRTSLKYIEFSLDMSVEEMPIHHSQRGLTEQDIQTIVDYCKNDIVATEALYNLTRGNTDNTFYKGKDKIVERFNVIEERKLKSSALNYSDVRIGETVVLQGYMQEAGIKKMAELYDRKKKGKGRKVFTFGDCIPKYIKFQTPEFQQFYNKVKKEPFKFHADPPQEFILKYNKTTYSIMKGGIHSHDPKRILEAGTEYIIRDADVGSQYPNAINKRNLYPSHLGPEWNTNYGKNIQQRLQYKEMGKKDPKYKGMAETWKLCLNGGSFGKTNDTFSVQYDPYVHFQCTIGNQFEILMLIEMMELEGIAVVSANTDGIVSMFPKELNNKYYQVCEQWEEIVGNSNQGKLEYLDYKKIVQTSVNDYLAIDIDGKVKLKGDFCKDVEIHKNKSKRIVPIALYELFVNGIPVEKTIKEHKSIWDFLIAKKASKDYYYQGINRKTGTITDYQQLVRYYCSKGIGEKLYKIKHEHSEKKGPKQSQCQSDSETQVMFNKPYILDNIAEYKIDYQFYIDEANKLVDSLLKEEARSRKIEESGQIELFD